MDDGIAVGFRVGISEGVVDDGIAVGLRVGISEGVVDDGIAVGFRVGITEGVTVSAINLRLLLITEGLVKKSSSLVEYTP